MKSCHRTAAVLGFAILAVPAVAAPPQGDPAPKALGFLEAGNDYIIRFPDSSNIFKHSMAGVTASTYMTADGKTEKGGPASWNATVTLYVFQVVRAGEGSWVLLRHPKSTEDFARWAGQRRARAILAGPQVKALEGTPEGRARLETLRAAAAAKIPTSETWVNLSHAITIAAMPSEDEGPKLTVKSFEIKP
jgi:hypothetical protein